MDDDPSIAAQVEALLKLCEQRNRVRMWERSLWEATFDQIGQLGCEAIPYLLAVIREADWDRADWATRGLARFGPQAVEAAPLVFAKLTEAKLHDEDSFETSAHKALVSMGTGCLDLMLQKVEHGSEDESYDALWIIEEIAPHDRALFEFYTRRLLHGRPGEQGIVVQFIARFPEYNAEALKLVSDLFLTTEERGTRWTAALTLVEMRGRAQIADDTWESFVNGLQQELASVLVQAEAVTAKAMAKDKPEAR